jgi:predicted RNA-binding Zn ribbon-like protein
VEKILAFVARDAVDLFTGIWIDRIRICENPLCGGLFADLPRPGRRRWCAMNTCGNLAKKEALQGSCPAHQRLGLHPTFSSPKGQT